MLGNMSRSLIPKQICDILFCYETGCLYSTQHSFHSCFHSVEVLRSYIMCLQIQTFESHTKRNGPLYLFLNHSNY